MGHSPPEHECDNTIKSMRRTSTMNRGGAQLQTMVFYWPTTRCRHGMQLLRLSVATASVVLLGAIRSPRERLKRNLGGVFVRLIDETVVAPQGGSVFAPLDNDAAGPGCPDTSSIGVVLELWLGNLVGAAVVFQLLNVRLRLSGHGLLSCRGVRDLNSSRA